MMHETTKIVEARVFLVRYETRRQYAPHPMSQILECLIYGVIFNNPVTDRLEELETTEQRLFRSREELIASL